MALNQRKVIENSSKKGNTTKAHAKKFQRPTYDWYKNKKLYGRIKELSLQVKVNQEKK